MLRTILLLASALALAGCGARPSLDVASNGGSTASSTASSSASTSTGTTGSSSGGFPQLARIRNDCGPTDGPAVMLAVDSDPMCGNALGPGVRVLVSGTDLTSLRSGVTLTIGSDPNAPTQAERLEGATLLTGVSGTVTFSSYIEGVSAAGSYDIAFDDGSSNQGAFAATWCMSTPTCG